MSEIKINWQILKDKPLEAALTSTPKPAPSKRPNGREATIRMFEQDVLFVTTLIYLEQEQIRRHRENLRRRAGL